MTTVSPGPGAPAPDRHRGHPLLAAFLRPRRVALVGASRNPTAISGRPARFLREWGFAGEVVVVNPGAVPSLHGFPAVGSLAEAGPGIDVAMVLVGGDRVVPSLEACAEAGIDHVVVIASGFEDDSPGGLRADLRRFLALHPAMRLLGPNCIGALSVSTRASLCFSSVLLERYPRPGGVSLVSQSGAIANALLLALIRRGAGLAHCFSTGDELSIGALELATALVDDEETTSVGLFLEGLTDAGHLPALAEAIDRTGKRVVAFRPTATSSARLAALSHTGRVIGSDAIARAALEQAGIHLAGSVDELCDTLTVLSVVPPRRAPGRSRVGIVTVSGGAGVIAADAVERTSSLELATLDAAAAEALEQVLPRGSTVGNPLDVPTLGDPTVFVGALQAVARSERVDATVVVASTLAHDYDQLSRTAFPAGAPVVITHLSPEERFSPEQCDRLAEGGVATVPRGSSAVAALAVWAGSVLDPSPSEHARPDDTGQVERLGILDTSRLIGPFVGDVMARATPVASADAAVGAAAAMGGTVALKADGRIVAHRTEAGAVRVGLSTPAEVGAAFDEVASRSDGDDVVVQAMARPGLEVMVSCVRDPEIGPVVVLRPGGVLVELTGRSTVLVGPPDGWADVVDRSPLGDLLAGWRGAHPADGGALLALAAGLLASLRAEPRIELVECNPVIVHPAGAGLTVVDAVAHRTPRPEAGAGRASGGDVV